jgi:hypothetical protein
MSIGAICIHFYCNSLTTPTPIFTQKHTSGGSEEVTFSGSGILCDSIPAAGMAYIRKIYGYIFFLSQQK